jgi:N-acylneuraminate cytidylyltransferase
MSHTIPVYCSLFFRAARIGGIVRLTAVIPVKGSSSRIQGKNILPFAGTNLLIHKIRQLKNVLPISEILVSSDSDEMLTMAESEGVRSVKRPADLSDESRPFGDLVRYIIQLLDDGGLMWSPVTSPTLDEVFYAEAIEAYHKALENGYDSLTTVIPFKHFLMDAKGPFNFAPDKAVTNSQDLPEMDLWTCGCSIISNALAYEKRFIFGDLPFRFAVTPYQAIDIDTTYDYENAKAMWEVYHD